MDRRRTYDVRDTDTERGFYDRFRVQAQRFYTFYCILFSVFSRFKILIFLIIDLENIEKKISEKIEVFCVSNILQ